jgi:hypothetical protein
MSNLKSARQAIKAELEHARKGASYYQARVDALGEALRKIDDVDADTDKKGQAKAVRNEASTAPKKRGRKARSQPAGNGAKLPSTGKDFWPNLITEQPQSSKDILNAAVKSLGISPSKEQMKKLTQRQTSALHNLIKTNAIADSGAGRERRFFRKH